MIRRSTPETESGREDGEALLDPRPQSEKLTLLLAQALVLGKQRSASRTASMASSMSVRSRCVLRQSHVVMTEG
jgi:hypothetical protein